MDLRKIDALVAEKLMGWTRVEPWQDVFGYTFECADPNGKRSRWDDVPHYSSDIAAAWGVVEAWRKLGGRVEITALPSGRVQVAFPAVAYAEEATAELAICTAALRAKDALRPQ